MAKEAGAVLGSEGVESIGQGWEEFIEGASGCLTEVGFEFGEGHFDGVEIWAVGRQVTQAGPLGRDECLDILYFMGGEVIEDDNVTFSEDGAENVLEVGGKDIGVDSSFDQERSLNALRTQGGDEGGGLPVTVGDGPNATLVRRATPIEPSHSGVKSGFVDEDQTLTVPLGLTGSPSGSG